VAVLRLGGSLLGIDLRDDLAYIAGHFNGLRVVDISNPSQPTEVESFDTPGQARDVALLEDHAFVADGPEGLRVIDISDPAAPFEVGSYMTATPAVSVAVEGVHGYVSVADSGLVILDISEPTAPAKVGAFDRGASWTDQVVEDEGYVFLAYEGLGLWVLDVSDPGSPRVVGCYDTSGRAVGVTVTDDHVFLADGEDGLHVLPHRLPRVEPNLGISPGGCTGSPSGLPGMENVAAGPGWADLVSDASGDDRVAVSER
jgi:hypothetical protein